MMNVDELSKLTNYVEENIRASQRSGMGFIDPKNYKMRMHAKQNHVAYGRRGSGKSSLLSCLLEADEHFNAYINIEDYKSISFPNILLYVLRSFFLQMIDESRRVFPWYKGNLGAIRSRQRMRRIAQKIDENIAAPDIEKKELAIRKSSKTKSSAGLKSEIADIGGSKSVGSESEEKKTVLSDKHARLQLSLTQYKDQIQLVSDRHGGRLLFLSLDDLYFIRKEEQPYFVDFFHRIAKGTNLYIKAATIKHRTNLYEQSGGEYIGMESGHDILAIDMDYSLDRFEELKGFMETIVNLAIQESGAEVQIQDMFAGDAFSQLCLASGGVPRDFLSLFLKLASTKLTTGDKIGKVDVTDAAINSIGAKLDAIRRDSGSEAEVLESYLYAIKKFVYSDKRTNTFLVAKEDLESHKQMRQAIRELVDMRLLHLIDSNTSCAPSDGRRYEAFIIDVGLYDNSRPRNFSQLEPGSTDDRSRRDELRASPRLDVHEVATSPGLAQLQLTKRGQAEVK